MARAPATQPASFYADKVIELEVMLKSSLAAIKGEIGTAVREAVKDLASKVELEQLRHQISACEMRVRELEAKNAYAAGAAKVESRVDDQAQQWARTIIPMLWPICMAASAYFISGGFNAG